ncbi:SRPBCC domain-containing protein [Paenibacillus sp. TRM 82003]|uniref:SRPBCC family protein n=1 Tax=Kineococcus sp. TRM81007 TaxID=2925831 RepID=UPI001F58A1E5|nr:SRPBCC domain-containing protein [Kineococcus sp. TRM81007]MCI2238485.1 SRPBCC domain-containing protein [Kineococcus sp. TRM81007]MCI3922003.1 SRPBCC domain-containing protein [Paenibacillus sp. TRM 82003]
MSQIHKSVDFDVPASTLWRALTEKDLLATWLMPNDFEPRVGHRFTMSTDPAPFFDGTVHLQVLEIDAPHRMRWSWRGGPIDTVVTFTVTELGPGSCRFDFLQEGFHGGKAQFARFFLDLGWRKTGRVLLRTVVRTLEATSVAR